MTQLQAIAKLKEAKRLLKSGEIDIPHYESLESELMPSIMTDNRATVLKFINENLEWKDNSRIAEELKVIRKSVCDVRHGRMTSKRILDALYQKAVENKQQADNAKQHLKQA